MDRISSSAGSVGEVLEGEPHHHRAADDQGGAPDQVGPGAGLETADEDVDGGDGGDQPAHRGEVVENRDGVVVLGDELGAEKITEEVVTNTRVTMAGMAIARRATPSKRYWRNSGMV